MTVYANMNVLHQTIKTDKATDDPNLLRCAHIVSRRIDQEMVSKRPLFAPYFEARKFRVNGRMLNSYDGTLTFPGYLLEPTTIVAGTTTLTLGTNVELYPDSTMPPFNTLRLSGNCPTSWNYYAPCTGCNTPYFVTITGWWGLHRDYAAAKVAVDALAAAINASVTTITVADVDGADEYGNSPRLSVGDLIWIDDELMEVNAVNTSTNALTVRRGQNGTTAASHLISAAVYVWRPEETIQHVTAKQSGLVYARRGAYTTVEVSGMSEVRYPVDLLTELRNVLGEFQFVGA